MEKGLRIVKLVAENVKGLKAVEIIPDEYFQVIAGRNGQGKSSVLDAIWLALGGGTASKGLARPVRDGADYAMASLDLGEYIVTRKWSSNEKSTLQVTSKEGAKFSSPQKMLDDLIGKLSFDPLAFSNLDIKAQLKTLLELVNIDPAPIEFEKKKVFDERTIVNREVKVLKAQLEALPKYDDSVPDEEIQSLDILKKMQQAQEIINHNTQMINKYNQLGEEYKSLHKEIEFDDKEIERLESTLKTLKNQRENKKIRLQGLGQEGADLQVTLKSLSDPDMTVFNKQLAEVDEINKKVREKKAANELIAKYQAKSQESETLTLKISQLEQSKQEMIAKAELPIQGLSFDDSGVLYNGVPFKQCSAAERLRVSMAMAMALNPKLKVIRILDGSLLDSMNMKLIQEMVKEKDYQVWVEVVDESGKVGVVIEDGMVKENN